MSIQQVDIEQQLQKAYLDYAMSVIVARALPDVRDGLKPVHRRILYAMYDMGIQAQAPYKKSARIVGEVLGKYHPHGDVAVYDAMARMAQDFSMRLPLIDGQGNFGSVDGDRPAAMRYTEARLERLSHEMMLDIEAETVNFVPNFDGSLQEPSLLPTRFPNFLVNGATGIAVGMATSVPPHNLAEVCDALIFMLKQQLRQEEVTLDDLLKFIQGPDFPTGGIAHRYSQVGRKAETPTDQLATAYALGRGRVTVQAKVQIEETSRNRHRLIVTELPYQTNKANLVERIADLTREGKLEGISDLRDESDRQGMRLVIELTRAVDPKSVLKSLFKLTPMQSTFSINMLALVEGEPVVVPLRRALQLFISHRQEIITRRSQHELNQAQQRLHILAGLRIALARLTKIVQTIINSASAEEARTTLSEKFKLTLTQAQAILDIPLRRLAALERQKIETEYQELGARITELESLLTSPDKVIHLIMAELTELKTNYPSPRLTTIVTEPLSEDQIITAADLIPAEAIVVALSRQGRVCRWRAPENLQPARQRQDDPLQTAILAHTHDTLCLLTARGQAIILPMHQVPLGAAPGDGLAVAELTETSLDPLVALLTWPPITQWENGHGGYLFMVTQQGRVKRTALSDLLELRGHENWVMGLDDNDTLLTGFITPGEAEIILVTQLGQAIRFAEEEVRPMGLGATGVWGLKLSPQDKVVGASLVAPEKQLLVVTRQGWGKCTNLTEYAKQARHGQGVSTIALTQPKDSVIAAKVVHPTDRVMFISKLRHNKLVYAKTLPPKPRFDQGESLMAIRGRDEMVEVVVLAN